MRLTAAQVDAERQSKAGVAKSAKEILVAEGGGTSTDVELPEGLGASGGDRRSISNESRGSKWRSELRLHAEALRRPEGDGVVFLEIVVPSRNNLTDEERASVDAGGAWPVRHRRVHVGPEHCRLIQFLVDHTIESWGSKCE